MSNLNDFVIENGVLKKYNGNDVHVVVPEGVTAIGDSAFFSTNKLISIEIPNSVTSIGKNAFQYCQSLTEITIPDSVTSIGKGAFIWCEKLERITLSNSIEHIRENVFTSCRRLETINIPASVCSIGTNAFSYCNALRDIDIPDNVVEIKAGAFKCCPCLADENGLVIVKGVLYGCYSDAEHIVVPEGVTKIDADAFKQCGGMVELTFPTSFVDFIREDYSYFAPFERCEELRYVNVPNDLRISSKILPYKARYCVSDPENFFKTAKPRNIDFVSDYMPMDDEDMAYAWLFQSGKKWKDLIKQRMKNPKEVLRLFAKIYRVNAVLPEPKVKNIKEYLDFYADELDATAIRGFLKDICTTRPKVKKKLEDVEIVKGISEEKTERNPIEALAEEMYATPCEYRGNAEAVVKKGLLYADGSGVSSKKAVVVFLEKFIEKWYAHSYDHHGDMSVTRQISRVDNYTKPEEACRIGDAFDRHALIEFLDKLSGGTQYREFLFAYLTYADESHVESIIRDIRVRRKGKARDKYRAENFTGALYISDTKAAFEFIESDRECSLGTYVRMRGYENETDYRDTVMLSDFGFDADGIKRYDIGGNVIVVSLNENLAPVLYDTKAKKALKSFPKKSDDPEKAAACAEDYAQLKKDIKDFYKKRREYMLQLYMNNEKITFDVWNKIYCNHPLLKHLTEMVIWQDEESVEFMVKDGKCFDVKGEEYVPDTKISPAHVLDMTEQDIRDWQNYLATTKTKLLIDQVWEPIVSMDENIRSRYDGYVITAKDRNALKKELKDKGIDVRAERYGGDFNHRAWQYEFDPEADMILGNCAKLHYVVDEQRGDLTLGTLTTYGNRGGKRELNAVIHALDKASVKAGIAADRAELLTKDFLERFTAAQIIDFISFAAEKKSSNCAAVLLEFKNESFEAFDATDEFTLDF